MTDGPSLENIIPAPQWRVYYEHPPDTDYELGNDTYFPSIMRGRERDVLVIAQKAAFKCQNCRLSYIPVLQEIK